MSDLSLDELAALEGLATALETADERFDESLPTDDMEYRTRLREATNAETAMREALSPSIVTRLVGMARASLEISADTRRDAERWQAFLGSQRIRIYGTAGPNDVGYAHFSGEFWTRHGGGVGGQGHANREFLIRYADAAIRATSTPEQTDERFVDIGASLRAVGIGEGSGDPHQSVREDEIITRRFTSEQTDGR